MPNFFSIDALESPIDEQLDLLHAAESLAHCH
jgi:hypothetical protein